MPATYTVDTFTGCWIWQGSKNAKGYGYIRRGGKTYKTHRWMYEQKHGTLPPNVQLDHRCSNTSCINPDHLEPVTNAENTRRSRVTKLTIEQVSEIRRKWAAGEVTQQQLGDEFGVNHSTISNIVTGYSWVAT